MLSTKSCENASFLSHIERRSVRDLATSATAILERHAATSSSLPALAFRPGPRDGGAWSHHRHRRTGRGRGAFMIGETTVRVRYAETDQMGVVYHSNFIIWFEVGRVELLRQMGFDYRRMEIEDGCAIAVVDVRCRYKAPVRYDEIIAIRTRLMLSAPQGAAFPLRIAPRGRRHSGRGGRDRSRRGERSMSPASAGGPVLTTRSPPRSSRTEGAADR